MKSVNPPPALSGDRELVDEEITINDRVKNLAVQPVIEH